MKASQRVCSEGMMPKATVCPTAQGRVGVWLVVPCCRTVCGPLLPTQHPEAAPRPCTLSPSPTAELQRANQTRGTLGEGSCAADCLTATPRRTGLREPTLRSATGDFISIQLSKSCGRSGELGSQSLGLTRRKLNCSDSLSSCGGGDLQTMNV